jgi:predicted nucleic acid-binding protein
VRGPVYWDASGLAKLYLPEVGSEALNAAVAGRQDLLLSDLALTELTSALCRRRREGTITADVPQRVWAEVMGHVQAGLYEALELSQHSHRAAERRLLGAGGEGLRALDALHLALALEAGAGTMICFDTRLRRAALGAGLALYPPGA